MIDKKLQGFSLIEIAFVLLIMGIAASITFPLLTASHKLEGYKATQVHQDQIFRALAGYVLKYFCLPSPSTPELAGKQGIPCKERKEPACVGILPYQELGISESLAKDGHGRWFTYVVAKELTRQEHAEKPLKIETIGVTKTDKVGFCNVPAKGINLTSLLDVPVLDKNNNDDFIAVVLISHGVNGAGAFHETTNRRLPAKHLKELENSTAENKFYMRASQDEDSDFTNQVYWVTRNNLMAIYGKYPCQLEHENLIYMGQKKDAAPQAPPTFLKNPAVPDNTGLYTP